MKIIKPGKVHDELVGTCHACAGVLECHRGEAQLSIEGPEGVYVIRCPTPTCERMVRLKAAPPHGREGG